MRVIALCALWLCACSDGEESRIAAPKIPARTLADALQPYVSVNAPTVLLSNAAIHVGDGQRQLDGYSVLIKDGRIVAVARTGDIAAPDDALSIDLTGHTIMPGIVGMHNHTHMPGNTLLAYTAPRLYLAGGVTTMATAGSADAAGEIALAGSIEREETPGPRIFPSAPYITGPGGNGPMTKPESAEAARVFVAEWADAGAVWFKLYRHTDPDIAAAFVDAVHKRGLKVTGHLCSITYREAAAMGIDSIEHGLNASTDFIADKPRGECVSNRAALGALDPDEPEIGALIADLVANDVTITSTLAILESGFPHRPQADERSLRALSPSRVADYEERQRRLSENAGETSATPALWNVLLAFERRFVEAGGRLVAGPDTGRHVLPGYGDQRNFELLVEAGFSAPEVVKIMTHNGAVALGIGDEVGLVSPGYRADLVVMSGALTKDPSSIRNVRIVFRDGVGFDPAKLIADVEGQVGDR